MSRSTRTAFFAFTAIGLGIAAALLAGELVARVFFYPTLTPDALQRQSLLYEPVAFARHTLRPGPRVVEDAHGNALYRINRQGYRGDDFESDKPAGTLRIIFLGGSAVFDVEAGQGRDWPHRTGALLRERNLPVEVINAAVPGHSSADSLGRFLTELHSFHPDYVLLSNAWNDLKHFGSSQPLLRVARPYTPNQEQFYAPAGVVDELLSRYSVLYFRARTWVVRWALDAPRIALEGAVPVHPEGRSDEVNPRALAQYRLTLEVFVDAVRDSGAVAVLMTQPRLSMSSETDEEKRRTAYTYTDLTARAVIEEFRLTDQTAQAVAAEKQAALLDASAALTGRSDYFADHIHLNAAGSRALSELTADFFAELINAAQSGGDGPSAARPLNRP